MRCPNCDGQLTTVLDSRPTPDGMTRRKRGCALCGETFWTLERPEYSDDNDYGADAYQREAMRTASGMTGGMTSKGLILNGVMGLNGEAGECIDLVKKHEFQGHSLDRAHLALELGDVAWYLAVTAQGIGYRLSDILRLNAAKLRKRYPDGFTSDNSIHRAKGDL